MRWLGLLPWQRFPAFFCQSASRTARGNQYRKRFNFKFVFAPFNAIKTEKCALFICSKPVLWTYKPSYKPILKVCNICEPWWVGFKSGKKYSGKFKCSSLNRCLLVQFLGFVVEVPQPKSIANRAAAVGRGLWIKWVCSVKQTSTYLLDQPNLSPSKSSS